MTAIEWTDTTWNPVTGCSKVSPGCAHCYAETLSLRFGWSKLPWTPENAEANVVLHPERLRKPFSWREPRMVFVNSMSDLFHEEIPLEFLAQVWDVMVRTPQHTYQILTKRPERIARALGPDGIGFYAVEGPVRFPQPNIWLGTSIENMRWVGRADALREMPAAVRFISAEPLLGPLVEWMVCGNCWDWPDADCIECEGLRRWPSMESLNLTGIDWLIVGGESGPMHRPIKAEWVRDLRDLASFGEDTAFFFKQWGGRTPKSGGRLLDGRTWDEYPERRAYEREVMSAAGRAEAS